MVCHCDSGRIDSVFRSVLCWLGPIAFVLGLALSSAATGVEVTPLKGGQFVGVAGCKSSSCHGGAGEKRDQYFTWSKKDFHTRAYAILTDARSARMAESLRLPAAAPESARCTVCHSPFQSMASARLMPAHPDEGVSCESCRAS